MVEAPDQRAAIARLREKRLSVTEIKPSAGKKKIKGSVKSNDVVMFSRQLSTLVSAGVPLSVAGVESSPQPIAKPATAESAKSQ